MPEQRRGTELSTDPQSEDQEQAPRAVVAIDGPSGAGKSTVARRVAEALGFAYLDTGAMYRAVTWQFLRRGCAPEAAGGSGVATRSSQEQQAVLAALELSLGADGRVLADGRDVTAELRTRDVEARVSAVAAMTAVRARMRALQRQIAAAGPVVAEGRDMGSVVFPRARWKVYLDASEVERARRRRGDFLASGREVSERDVRGEIAVRDHLDSTRQDAPLTRVPDAQYLDTSSLDIEQVVAAIVEIVRGDLRPSEERR